ncbi:VOC family protein [bacterium]|nr:VOC family protein [bacterium]
MFNNPNVGLIDPRAKLGIMRLAVADLAAEKEFYQQKMGFAVLDESGESVLLGTEENPLLRLESRPKGYRDPQSAGLYHIAFLLPSRSDLANWLEHYASQESYLDGVGDHLVSEALYLHDPEGNGIEVYRDRPRDEWTFENGNVVMGTESIDLNDLIQDRTGEPYRGAPAGTKNGHIHLAVANVPEESDFYQNVLGMGLQAEYYSARFLSAGGYHHHIGLNSWERSAKRQQDENRLGLLDYEIVLPNQEALGAIETRLDESGYALENSNGRGKRVVDPDGIGVVLTSK